VGKVELQLQFPHGEEAAEPEEAHPLRPSRRSSQPPYGLPLDQARGAALRVKPADVKKLEAAEARGKKRARGKKGA
jgi:hypothetical protein